ncbi:GHMP kinase [Neolewinella aurantiaca]|uniref:GHMP kinase n=1 Tax=Neolewinella aurantiaca TaxID=2602767 RepID=A0A5C7FF37_9BACT|nr:GYDIA family GHMP kinase [Neolewinella aurantiaca]TXF89388.1 GHMP kinase [Neolewinella aurantiaca]
MDHVSDSPSIQLAPHGKLLLTGEYFVLDGVPALAVPTRRGQSFEAVHLSDSSDHDVYWKAYDVEGWEWFNHAYDKEEWARAQVQSEDPRARILQILYAAETLNPGCTRQLRGVEVSTHLQFDRKWGLGSSSTLIAAVAKWLGVNPYALLEQTFGGSGYDLACAFAEGPILYERNGTSPKVTPVSWEPDWLQQTCFVYLNQKQNSREGIRAYRSATVSEHAKTEIRRITTALLTGSLHLRAAARLLLEHEEIVGNTLGLIPVQQKLFPGFPGAIKSLGAWGGDFVWALSEDEPEKIRKYFNERGYEVVIGYDSMVV